VSNIGGNVFFFFLTETVNGFFIIESSGEATDTVTYGLRQALHNGYKTWRLYFHPGGGNENTNKLFTVEASIQNAIIAAVVTYHQSLLLMSWDQITLGHPAWAGSSPSSILCSTIPFFLPNN
jgi:hypothetical protein